MTAQVLERVDQTIELHEQAIEHLKAYRDTLHLMQGSLEAVGGIASAPAPSHADKSKKTKAASAAASTKKASASTDENDISLREAVWQIVTRKENKGGIKVAAIISTIKEEDLWKTDGDLANMVHGAVYKFKQDGKLVRGDDRTYKVVSGATL